MRAEFVLDDGVSLPDIAAALGDVRTEGPRSERRTWYDTFDWLLHDAGLVLEQHRSRLTLTDLAGNQLDRSPGLDALPERVSKVIGIRALLPRATASGPVRGLAVLDEQSKPVARVYVVGPLTAGDETLSSRAWVEPLRGYEQEAGKAVSAVTALEGVSPAPERLHQEVFRACGVRPGDYRAKPKPVSGRSQPAERAYGALLGDLLDITRANLDGTLAEHDTEFLHDLRVAVRRARSLLKVSKGVLPDAVVAKLRTELKWLGDATSASRDLDVYLLGFDSMARAVPDPTSLEPFRALLTRHRRQAHTRLNRALRSARFARLVATWESAREPEPGPAGEIGAIADKHLHRAWRRVEKRGAAITDASPADDLHDLRKRCKELRYLLEFFAGLYDSGTHRELVSELKKLQDNLGRFQDAESQLEVVVAHADELAERSGPAGTMLSMGRLEEQLERRQADARAEFADRWQRFDRPHNRRLFDGLVRL